MDAFWAHVNAQLDHIERDKPDTAQGVIDIMNQYSEPSSGQAFFHDGSDRSLMGSLYVAGWEEIWSEAWYYYVAKHPVTGEMLTYVEGDVYEGDQHL